MLAASIAVPISASGTSFTNAPNVVVFNLRKPRPICSIHGMAIFRLLRPRHWIKNLLVFAPLFFSQGWNGSLALQAAVAFISLSFLASAAYAINDIQDVNEDRRHPTKRYRPVAKGEVSTSIAFTIALVLIVTALTLAAALSFQLFIVCSVYTAVQLLYSFLLKRYPIIDILLLSTMMLLRVVAGAAACSIRPSTWILNFTWFISLMLATGKRYSELQLQSQEETRPVLSSYSANFLQQLISSLGVASLICYLLWSSETATLGRFSPLQILPSGLLVAYGILRYELLLLRNMFHEDPTVGLFQDLPIVCTIITFIVYLLILMYVP